MTDAELNQLKDFFQTSKYSNNQDIQAAAYFYLAIISYQLGNNNLATSYITEFLRMMPDDLIGFIILANSYYAEENYIDALSEYQKIIWAHPNHELALFQQGVCFYKLNYQNHLDIYSQIRKVCIKCIAKRVINRNFINISSCIN